MNHNTRYMRPPGPCHPFIPQMNAGPKQCPWQMSDQQPRFFRPPVSQVPFSQNGFNSFNRHPPSFNRPPPSFNRPPPPFNRPPSHHQNVYNGNNMFEQKEMNNNFCETFANSQKPQQWQVQKPGQFPNHGRGGQRGSFRGRGRGNGNFNMNNGNNQKNSQHQKAQKKEKLNKRDLPENNVHYCDTCDRGFKTQDKYQEHVDGHTKCTYKDCPFIAAPKLVQLHMNMQHRNGFASKIYSLESQEDVKKWREERKRQFPTADNIEKKKQLREERIARGEVIENKDFSKMKGRGRGRDGRGRGRGKGRGRKWRDFDETQGGEDGQSDDESPPEIANISRPQGESKDAENDAASKSLTLLAGYGDSSGDEESSNVKKDNSAFSKNPSKISEVASSEQEPQLPSVVEVLKALSSDLPTLEVLESPDSNVSSKPEPNEPASSRKRKGDGNHPGKSDHKDKKAKGQSQAVPKKKYTLLEKLLAPEIRRERNVILQCVHYIVKNNFFEVDASSSNTYSSQTS